LPAIHSIGTRSCADPLGSGMRFSIGTGAVQERLRNVGTGTGRFGYRLAVLTAVGEAHDLCPFPIYNSPVSTRMCVDWTPIPS
jgi:hypothetical protein